MKTQKKEFPFYCSNESKYLCPIHGPNIGLCKSDPNDCSTYTGKNEYLIYDIKSNPSRQEQLEKGSWIHPDLAIQLAQWISPLFALRVSKWIRTLFTNKPVSVDIKLLEDKELKLKDQKIQLLEDTYNKKQKRENYPLNNYIYILTTEQHKQNQIYIIGKTTNLMQPLSGYNKTEEHQVIYKQECKTTKSMDIIKKLIIDRFKLPSEKDINYFIEVINRCITFIDILK